jgi:hypothetical protein
MSEHNSDNMLYPFAWRRRAITVTRRRASTLVIAIHTSHSPTTIR